MNNTQERIYALCEVHGEYSEIGCYDTVREAVAACEEWAGTRDEYNGKWYNGKGGMAFYSRYNAIEWKYSVDRNGLTAEQLKASGLRQYKEVLLTALGAIRKGEGIKIVEKATLIKRLYEITIDDHLAVWQEIENELTEEQRNEGKELL